MNDLFDDDEFGGESVFAPSTEPSTEGIADTNASESDVSSGETQETLTDEAEQVIDEEAKTEKSDEATEEELEAALADEKTPKWFKNAVEKVYKPKLGDLTTEVEQFRQYGTPEELSGRISLLNALSEVRTDPYTGMPVRTAENFVKQFYEQDAEGAVVLLNELAQMPSPRNAGMTMIQEVFRELGIDPNRLNDVKSFADNGYTMQAREFAAPDPTDLESIRPDLQATFAKLDPQRRDELLYMDESIRNASLEDSKIAFEYRENLKGAEERQEQQKQAAEQQQQAEMKRNVDAKSAEYFNKSSQSVVNSFTDSLVKKAGMSNLDASMITNTVLNSFEPTFAGEMSRNALKAEGIEIDPVIQQTIEQLSEVANHAAYYELHNNQEMLRQTVAKQVALQEKLAAKGNKIVAALAAKRSSSTTKVPADVTSNTRHAVAGSPSTGISSSSPQNFDYSDDAYLDDIRAAGGIRTGR